MIDNIHKVYDEYYNTIAVRNILLFVVCMCALLIIMGNVQNRYMETLVIQNHEMIEYSAGEIKSDTTVDIIEGSDSVITEKYQYINTIMDINMVKYVDYICDIYNVNPHMMLAIFEIESSYIVDADNPTSSARGLGQILRSTGEYVYEQLLQRGEYDHVMAYDPYLNIEISVKLMQHNIEISNGNVIKAIQKYSGTKNKKYYNSVCNIMNCNGIQLYSAYYS